MFLSVSIIFDNVKPSGSNMFLMKESYFSITKSKNAVIFSLGKLEAAVARQKPHMTQFPNSQFLGFAF